MDSFWRERKWLTSEAFAQDGRRAGLLAGRGWAAIVFLFFRKADTKKAVIRTCDMKPNHTLITQRHQSKTKPAPALECHAPFPPLALALARSLSLREKIRFHPTTE
jgi:hypothetical protein